jgi:hypothetical protein
MMMIMMMIMRFLADRVADDEDDEEEEEEDDDDDDDDEDEDDDEEEEVPHRQCPPDGEGAVALHSARALACSQGRGASGPAVLAGVGVGVIMV